MKKNKFNNNVSLIKRAINNDKLVVFAGAGVSKDSGIPLWNELIEEIKSFLNEEIEEDDPLKIAQILYNEKGEKEYNDIIKNSLYKSKGIYNSLHEILFELNPQHIITTNYDHYFENIIENKGLPFSVVSKDIDLPYAEHKNLLIKYHGDFENKNIVFKETDYLEFSKNNTLKEIFVKSLFSNKVILFVGYRVGDINLKLLIRDIQFILTKHHQRAYLLSHNTDISDSEIKYFENLGINIINYCEESLKFLKEKSKLSSVGNSVYKQLEFIRDFNLFEYERSKSNISSKSKIIDDLYTSLNRFNYFRVLPKSLLASLYPLNKDSEYDTIYNIESTTLVCYNKELYDLINEYKGKEDDRFSDEEKRKLNFSLTRLMYSNIYFIGKKVGGKDMLGNRRTNKEISLSDKYFSDNINCDCIDCAIGYFKYSDAILKIEKYNITDDSNLWDDLVFAYSLYQLEEFYKSYKAYEQIEVKSNQLKQMDVSFISMYNMKRIGINIQGFHGIDKRYSFKDLKEIENQAKKINLDRELSKIKYFVDGDIYRFLSEVCDGIYIQRLCNEIDELYNKVLKDVKKIQRGGAVISSDYINLYNAVKQLNSFLKGNFIIGNGFSAINYSLNKSIKAFILGYFIGTLSLDSNPKKFFRSSKFESFDLFLFEMIVEYSDPKDLSDFIKEQNITEIQFDEQSLNSVIRYISNFFQSSYEENMFGKKENEIYTAYLRYNYNFHKKTLHQFKNICIVLTYFKFPETQIKNIYLELNQFIKFTNIKGFDDFKFLKTLIYTKHEIIGNDLLVETLNILNSKEKQYNSLYITLLSTIKSLDSEFINNEFRVDNLTDTNFGYIKDDISIFYETLPSTERKKLLKFIENQLDNSFDLGVVYLLLLEKVLINRNIKNKYIESIHKILVTEKQVVKDDRFLYKILQYFDLINRGLLIDDQLSSIHIEAELFKFIINPENYNKNKFDVEWLKIFNYDSFIKRFCKIDYIIEKLDDYLISNNDKELNEIYFKLKKEKRVK